MVCNRIPDGKEKKNKVAVFTMGASISARQDDRTEEDATAEEQNAEVNDILEGGEVDAKVKYSGFCNK